MPISDFTMKTLFPSAFLVQKYNTHLLCCTAILSAFHAPLLAQNANEATTATPKPTKSIAQYYREGTDAFRNGRWQTAKEALNQVVMQAPESLLASEASFFAALATLRNGDENWLQELSDWRCQTQSTVFKFRSEFKFHSEEQNTTEATEPSPDETLRKQLPQKTVQFAIERLEKWLSESDLEEAKELIRLGQWRWALHALSSAQATERATSRASEPKNIPMTDAELWILRNQLECQVHLQQWDAAESTFHDLEKSISSYLTQPDPPTWIPKSSCGAAKLRSCKGTGSWQNQPFVTFVRIFPNATSVDTSIMYLLAVWFSTRGSTKHVKCSSRLSTGCQLLPQSCWPKLGGQPRNPT